MSRPFSPLMEKKPIQQKKLHLVWFVDSAKTNTFAISLRALQALVIVIFITLIAFGITVAVVFKQATAARTQNEYIKELKAALVAQVMVQSESVGENATAPTPPPIQTPQPAQPTPKETAVKATDEAAPESKPLQSAPPVSTAGNSQPAEPTAVQGGVGFGYFSLRENDSGNAVISITLSAEAELMGRTVSGHVCAVVLHKNGKRSAAPRFAALEPSQTCAKGVAVRFSRLRPTEIETNVPVAEIQSVELRFQGVDGSMLVTKSFSPE